MKKTIEKILILLVGILILLAPNVKADEEYITLDLTVQEPKESYEIYLLLPKSYIEYAIQQSGLKLDYNGEQTLRKYDIPGINIDKTKVQTDVYVEDFVEYVQILLEPTSTNQFKFNILKNYGSYDMRFRYQLKSEDTFTIMKFDNFKADNKNICKIVFNEKENTLKNEVRIQSHIALWQIIVIIAIIIAIIIFTKKIRLS